MKKIKICADPFPPYQYINDNGEAEGLDHELINAVFNDAGYSMDIKIAPWNEVIDAFEKKEYDALFQVQDTPERRKKYFLSYKLRDAVTDVVKVAGSGIQADSYDKLSEYRIGLIDGFANGEDIDRLPEECKIFHEDTREMIDALTAGEIDVAVCDRGVVKYLSGADEKLVPIEALTYRRPLYVMFHDRDLRDSFNASLKKFVKNEEDRTV